MRSILVNAYDDSGLDARLQVSADLVRAFEGHLTCLNATPYEMSPPGDPYGAAFAVMIPVMREAAEQLEKRVVAHLEKEDIAWDFVSQAGTAEDRLLAHSAINDLVVAGSREPVAGGKAPSRTVSALVVKARTPVLIVPDDARSFDTAAPAVVAWNGSTEACNALRAALPLLKKAGSVFLICANEPAKKREYDFPSLAGANYLSRHGIASEIVELPSGKPEIADQILKAANARDAGLIVMGAYGHRRLTETILGGVTRRMLSNVTVPLLLAH
ncbi:universal stress protein [Altererythrobacter aquiaggeris]|uniref:universal stress protein n=1 Tax=Aestuarierythrobacter aquiaggeris TaxID=1898396 RepID=UPI0030176DC5